MGKKSHSQKKQDSPATPRGSAADIKASVSSSGRNSPGEARLRAVESMGFGLPISDAELDAAFGTEETEIFVTGSSTWNANVPPEYREHAWIKNRCFYSLPLDLLKRLAQDIRPLKADRANWSFEAALSEGCGDHTTEVGYCDSRPISYRLLRWLPIPKPTPAQSKWLRSQGMNTAKLDAMHEKYEARARWYFLIARGYAGWLNCCQQFQSERDNVLRADLRVVSLVPEMFADVAGDELPANVRDFLVRWRLIGMAGPRLPIPMMPMLGGAFPLSIISQLMAAGGVFNVPDTYPIPSRGELRSLLEDAIRPSQPNHLTEWTQIIRKDNPAKNKIERYSRLLELKHYWELLHERHADHLKGETTKLQSAIAGFLNTSSDSIKRDLVFLRHRLGKDWPSF